MQKHDVGRMRLYYIIFTNLFNIWFNREQADSHMCFYIPSVCFWSTSASLSRYVIGKNILIMSIIIYILR